MYPKKLIKDISDSLDIQILEFVEEYKTKYKLDSNYILELVTDVIKEYMGEMADESAVRYTVRKERQKRKRSKERWLEKMEQSIKEDVPIKDHPLAFIYVLHNNLSKSEWNLQFNGKTLEEVIEEKYQESVRWCADVSMPLVSYPAIASLRPNRVIKALKSDVIISVFEVIDNKYGGNISSIWRSLPSAMIDVPFFSPRQERFGYEVSDKGLLVNEFIFGQNKFVTEYQGSDDFDVPELAFSNLDMQIISALFSRINSNFWFEPEIRFDLRNLVLEIKKNAGKTYFDTIKERLRRYPKYTFSVKDIGNSLCTTTFNLFDSVTIEEDSSCSASVIVRPGHFLTNALLKEKTTRVYKEELESLEKPLSKLLAFKIQRERIRNHFQTKDSLKGSEGYNGTYPYVFFESAVRMPYKRKEENMAEIGECLKEMKKRHIFIEDYERVGSKFAINFLPLTKEEEEDYKISSVDELVVI